MQNTMPPPVAAYVRALETSDASLLDGCLAENLRVNDRGENDVITGRATVTAWFAETREKFRLSVEIKDVREEDGKTVVAMLTSGDFDGSPLLFTYYFTVEDGKIVDVDILLG